MHHGNDAHQDAMNNARGASEKRNCSEKSTNANCRRRHRMIFAVSIASGCFRLSQCIMPSFHSILSDSASFRQSSRRLAVSSDGSMATSIRAISSPLNCWED